MKRIIEPSKDRLGHLPTPLNDGEKKVLNFLEKYLPIEWEIYIQPPLNGHNPDFIVLNPKVGIGIIEVKDWNFNFSKFEYFEHEGKLWAKNKRTRKKDCRNNPVVKIRSYKEAVMNLYCPGLLAQKGYGIIGCSLVFPSIERGEIIELIKSLQNDDERKYSKIYTVAGSDTLSNGNLEILLPLASRDRESKAISEDACRVFRGWLREPDSAREQYQPIRLDADQLRASQGRTMTGYRRVQGPAGSGKSEVVARKAALLAMQEKKVLVSCYNITMVNWLRDAIARHLRQECGQDVGLRIKAWHFVNIIHFHGWLYDCTRAFEKNNFNEENEDHEKKESWWNSRCKEIIETYKSRDSRLKEYDAIVVDEGQDLSLDWWNTLASSVKDEGERFLAYDKTQNIYGRARVWTEEAMEGAGFSGRPMSLKHGYRLARELIPIAQDYADNFMKGEEVVLPDPAGPDLFDQKRVPPRLRWVQIVSGKNSDDDLVLNIVDELEKQMIAVSDFASFSDFTILVQDHSMGEVLVEKMQKKLGVNVLDIFDKDKNNSRRKKMCFYKGTPKMKASTGHSYKGWETSHLLVFFQSFSFNDENEEQKCLFYVMFTRLKDQPTGSSLTIVCAEDSLRSFGRKWFPDFVEI